VPVEARQTGKDELGMRQGKKDRAEEILNLLRQVGVDFANRKTLPQACKKSEIVEQTYYRSGSKADQAQGLKELEHEKVKLRRLISELSVEC
jgi:putative transposase